MISSAEKKSPAVAPGLDVAENESAPLTDAARPIGNEEAAWRAEKAARAARKAAWRAANQAAAATPDAARLAEKAARAARKAAWRAAHQAALTSSAPPEDKAATSEVRPPAPTVDERQPMPTLESRIEGSSKAAAAAVRKARSRRLALRIALFVLVPTALAAFYFGLAATSQYESYSQFTVQSSEVRPTLGVEGLLAGITGSNGGQDALAVRDYVLSRDMLSQLDKKNGFIRHYQAQDTDWFSRLSGSASFEDAYKYYASKVYADYDQTSGSVTLRVRAFDADKAVAISQSILASSEEMVNKLSERQRRDRIAYAEADLKQAEERLARARKEIVALQQKHSDFSPQQTAGAAMQIRTTLEGELAKARAEVMQLKSYMKDDAPQVRAANEKVKAISAQVAAESRRLVDPSKPNGLNASFSDFEAAMVEKEFSEKVYQSSLSAFELARADANRQHRYLAVIAQPSKPDESTYPHRIRGVLAAFLLSFLLLGIGSLVVAAVREHARL